MEGRRCAGLCREHSGAGTASLKHHCGAASAGLTVLHFHDSTTRMMPILLLMFVTCPCQHAP